MKSYFFGLNAKVALALLAISGTVLTGCYEKEDGDTPLPYTPLPAKYVITVQVVNENAEPVSGATVSATGLNFTSGTNGQYVAETDKTGSYTITATHSSYDNPGTETVTVTPVAAGKVGTYFAFITLTNDPEPPVYPFEYTFTQETKTKKDVFSADSEKFADQIDWVNNGNEAKEIKFTITYDEGVTYKASEIPTGEFGNAVKAFLLNQYPTARQDGTFPTKDDYAYNLRLAPLSSLESITVETYYIVYSYVFTQGTDRLEIKVKYANAAEISNQQRAWGHGSGHAHNSHGHGGGLNAGGGIFENI